MYIHTYQYTSWCVYVCVSVYAFWCLCATSTLIHVDEHINARIHTHICTYAYQYTCWCVLACVCVFFHVCMCVCVRACVWCVYSIGYIFSKRSECRHHLPILSTNIYICSRLSFRMCVCWSVGQWVLSVFLSFAHWLTHFCLSRARAHSLFTPDSARSGAHSLFTRHYGVATVSRIDKIVGLFYRISSLL